MQSRRSFLTKSLFSIGMRDRLISLLSAEDRHGHVDLQEVRHQTLQFITSMRVADTPGGRYRYSAISATSTLYSSTYAAMTRHLYRDMHAVPSAERREWIDYLQSHQDDDGLFRDPVIFGEGWYRGDPLTCGRSHLTCHVINALTCLGSIAEKPIIWLNQFLYPDKLVSWLQARDWGDRVAHTGNEVLNVGTLLQYSRDFHDNTRCGKAVEIMEAWLEQHCDGNTGLWGVDALNLEDARYRSQAIQAAYHFWLLWFYDNKPIPYPDKAVDQLLRTQNPLGGYGWGGHNRVSPFHSSACEDIDSIDPLARQMCLSEYRRGDIADSLQKSEPWLLTNQTPSGSFCFMKDRPFSYGHPQLSANVGSGAMFPTWFRTLTLAYLGKSNANSSLACVDWQFCRCPGYQFWPEP